MEGNYAITKNLSGGVKTTFKRVVHGIYRQAQHRQYESDYTTS